MTGARFLIARLAFLLIVGCAVNDKEVASMRYFEYDSSDINIRKASSGYFSTRQSDGGLTLCHMPRTTVHPEFPANIHLSLKELFVRADDSSSDQEITQSDSDGIFLFRVRADDAFNAFN